MAAAFRPIRQPAAVPADAGHPDAARRAPVRRHRFRRHTREHRRRILVDRRPHVRRDRPRDGIPADGIHPQGRRSHHAIRVRARVDAPGEARDLGDQVQRHLDHDALLGRAVQGDGRAISGDPHRPVPHRHPERAIRLASRLVRRRRRLEPVRRHPVRSGSRRMRHDRDRAIGQHQSRARFSIDVRAGARLRSGHRRQGHRQSDRADLVGCV